MSISLTVNGVARTVALDDTRVTLLDLLRERLDLTGTKKGCDAGSAAPARSSSMVGDHFVPCPRGQS